RDARDGRCRIEARARLSLEIEQRPLRRFHPFSARVEQPEDDAVSAAANAGPDPLRDVVGARFHGAGTAIDVVSALQFRNPVWLGLDAAAHEIVDVGDAQSELIAPENSEM